jgi:hypothetical protein
VADQPALSHNPTSIAGAALTTISAVLFIVYVVLEAFGLIISPYAGLLGYLLVPAVFVVGLLLIPFGMWREGRRRRRGRAPWSWPALDFGHRPTRWVLSVVGLLTVVNLGIVAVASVGVTHYTESNQFCGQVCHTPMTPEFVAHQYSPHARVDCVSCHVSPGASGLISAKMNGTRQLYLLTVNKFSRPIPEPVGRIPIAADTCAHCHTPGRPGGDLVRTITTFGDDEKNTASTTTLTMHMGANHWHARSDVTVEYIATDASRSTIPYIRVTDETGKATEYFAEGVTSRPAGDLHRMDCLDCHNRPAHTFSTSPDHAVDALIASGGVSRDLPFLHREMVGALKADYPTASDADAGIAKRLGDFYRTTNTPYGPALPKAIEATQALYHRNVFPDMKVTWGTYPSQLGHIDGPGCFRCHDEAHKARDGRAVRQDCELCHKLQ